MNSENFQSMSVDALLEIRRQIDDALAERRKELERQLRQISKDEVLVSSISSQAGRHAIAPRYRSKKDPKQQWSGRGVLPKWMREEMEGTKLTKEDFRITAG